MANRDVNRGAAGSGSGMALLRRFPTGVLGSDNVVPVVLEFEQSPVAVYKRLNPDADAERYQAELAEMHQEFLRKLASLGMDVQIGRSSVVIAGPKGNATISVPHDFTQVFNGLGVLMPGRVVAQVAKMTGVRTVTLNQERVYLNLDKSVPFVQAPQIWERLDANELNVRGEGMVVAVLDTGVDHTHPAFGGFAEVPNEKVIHSVSYTGEHPIDNFGHGTHVAAIIAGDADYKGTARGDSQYNGVAPKAKLMGYKVLSASGSGSATNIILAMEDAVKRGVHVMNLSLGDSFGDPQSPESSAANNAMQAGVIVCVAAGNAGPEASTIGAPGSAHQVITVGASTDDGVTVLVAELTQEGQESRQLEMRPMEGSVALPQPAIDLTYVDCGMGLKATEFPRQVKDRIALVQRGETTFREKALLAEQAGALACVIYNNREGNFFGSLGEEEQMPQIPVIAISKADGEFMLAAIDNAGKISKAKLRLSPEEVPQSHRLAEFSSRGPNNDLWIKPELTAPGVNIMSATILQAAIPGGGMPDPTGYVSASGTSMATPHVAGAAALIKQAHPEWNSLQIKAAMVNTAKSMPGQGSVMDQGNGALDLIAAIDCRSILVTAADPISPTHSFGRVAHKGKEITLSQSLAILPLIGEAEIGSYKLSVEITGQPEGIRADLSAGTVVSGGKPTAGFDLKLVVDGAILPDGAYDGFVIAEAEWGTIRLPFYLETRKEASGDPIAEQRRETRRERTPERRRVGSMPCA